MRALYVAPSSSTWRALRGWPIPVRIHETPAWFTRLVFGISAERGHVGRVRAEIEVGGTSPRGLWEWAVRHLALPRYISPVIGRGITKKRGLQHV